MKKEELENAVRQYRGKVEIASSFTDDETALEMIELFPKWQADLEVKVDERYQYNGVLYRCVQAHTTQEGWTPDITPALWTRVSLDEWPEWIQPTGAQDAYPLGAKVSHNDKHWISIVDNNTWEPGVYGWEEP